MPCPKLKWRTIIRGTVKWPWPMRPQKRPKSETTLEWEVWVKKGSEQKEWIEWQWTAFLENILYSVCQIKFEELQPRKASPIISANAPVAPRLHKKSFVTPKPGRPGTTNQGHLCTIEFYIYNIVSNNTYLFSLRCICIGTCGYIKDLKTCVKTIVDGHCATSVAIAQLG